MEEKPCIKVHPDSQSEFDRALRERFPPAPLCANNYTGAPIVALFGVPIVTDDRVPPGFVMLTGYGLQVLVPIDSKGDKR